MGLVDDVATFTTLTSNERLEHILTSSQRQWKPPFKMPQDFAPLQNDRILRAARGIASILSSKR